MCDRADCKAGRGPTERESEVAIRLLVVERDLRASRERERALEALADELESYGKGMNPWSDEGWDKAEAMREAGAMLRAALAAQPDAPDVP